jgi:hypothetical protein
VRLWRPVGLGELLLIFQNGMRSFPPRLPDQPIFYPVLNEAYATQIARDWNAKAEPFAGYVTEFDLPDDYASQFPPQIVGASHHGELWVPAERLSEFNAQILGPVRVERAFFGMNFQGHIPDNFNLKGRDVRAQIQTLSAARSYSMFDFYMETCANEFTIYANFPFWSVSDSDTLGMDASAHGETVAALRKCWGMKPRPAPLIERGERAA